MEPSANMASKFSQIQRGIVAINTCFRILYVSTSMCLTPDGLALMEFNNGLAAKSLIFGL